MMNKLRTVWLPNVALLQLLMLLASLLYSWVANLYGVQVQNLLSTDGVRWILRHLMQNFQLMPISSLLLLLMGWGMLNGSGWLNTGKLLLSGKFPQLSPRQRWGFQVSILLGISYLIILSTGFWGSEPVLLSVTGTLQHSPLMDGLMVLLLIGVSVVSGSYAWISGRCTSSLIFLQYLAQGIADGAILFLNLFLLGQQIGFIQFMLSF